MQISEIEEQIGLLLLKALSVNLTEHKIEIILLKSKIKQAIEDNEILRSKTTGYTRMALLNQNIFILNNQLRTLDNLEQCLSDNEKKRKETDNLMKQQEALLFAEKLRNQRDKK